MYPCDDASLVAPRFPLLGNSGGGCQNVWMRFVLSPEPIEYTTPPSAAWDPSSEWRSVVCESSETHGNCRVRVKIIATLREFLGFLPRFISVS
ncbi:hypothetical protein Tco_0965415 [Tanacetum coccineum]